MTKREKWFTYIACLSLIMYVFGHNTEAGTLPFPEKLFYVPCALSLYIILGCKRYRQWYREDYYFLLFFALTFLNSIVIEETQWLHMMSCLLGFLIFRYIRHIDYTLCLRILFYASPIIVIIHYLYTTPFSGILGVRYGGFQGDPNCFAMAINVFIYANGHILNNAKSKIEKSIAIFSLIGLFTLVMASQSRAGLGIAGLLLLVNVWDLIKKNRGIVIISLAAFLSAGIYFAFSKYGDIIEMSFSRFGDSANEGDKGSAMYRFEEFGISYNLLTNNLVYLPLGIGFSKSETASGKFKEYTHMGRSHNTYCSVLMEQGIIGLILYLGMLLLIFTKVFGNRRNENGWAKLTLLTCLYAFSFTIFSLPFLPFWFGLFLSLNTWKVGVNKREYKVSVKSQQ